MIVFIVHFVKALYSCSKICCLYFLREFDGSKKAIDELKSYRSENLGNGQYYEAALCSVLVYYSLSNPKDHVERIKSNVDFLRKHNEINSDYFQGRLHLAEAIQESIFNEDEMIIFKSFQKALKSTESSDFLFALTHEYFGEFCNKTKEFKNYGKFLENEAYLKYFRIEAVCKYKHLTKLESKSSNTTADSGNTISSSPTTSTTAGEVLQLIFKQY